MANYTPNLNLEKPLQTEGYDVDVFNANADKIDTFAGQVPARALTADKLTTGAKINGVNFKGDTDITLPVATTSVAGTVMPDGESISIDSNGRIFAALPEAHALKGYLESGQSYTDTTLYNDVYGYNHSTFDLSKFTKVGSMIITDDGIASVTANGNMTQRVSIPFNFDLTAKKWSIISNFTTDSAVSAKYTIGSWQTNDALNCYYVGGNAFKFTLYVDIDGTRTQVASGNISLPNLVQFRTNTKYIQIVSRNNDTYTYTIYNASNPSETGTITITSEYDLYNANVLCVYSNSSSSSLKSCNLKEVKVVVNDYPIFSGNKTNVDVVKPDSYRIQDQYNTLVVSENGIASGFSDTSAMQTLDINYDDLLSKDTYFEFDVKFTTPSSWTKNGSFWADGNNLYFGHTTSGVISGAFIGSAINQTNLPTLAVNTTYNAKFIYDATGFYVKFKKADENTWTSSTPATVTSTETHTLQGLIGSAAQDLTAYYTGSIDLNSIKFYVNGNLVYQACLLIPYTQSLTGAKIVDSVYRDRVIDVYEQFGSANYYTIDETNKNVTLPMGEIYGFIEQKTSTDFDNVTQTAKNTSISWGMPDWSRAISKTVYTEYTATGRGWINAEGKSADKKVGLTINSNIVAAAEATGTSDESCFACLVPIDIGDVYNTFKTGTNVQDEVTSIQFIPCKGDI